MQFETVCCLKGKMSEVESVGKALIKVIPFTGNKQDWPIWSEKFLPRGTLKITLSFSLERLCFLQMMSLLKLQMRQKRRKLRVYLHT